MLNLILSTYTSHIVAPQNSSSQKLSVSTSQLLTLAAVIKLPEGTFNPVVFFKIFMSNKPKKTIIEIDVEP
jgi:hypothetical protein